MVALRVTIPLAGVGKGSVVGLFVVSGKPSGRKLSGRSRVELTTHTERVMRFSSPSISYRAIDSPARFGRNPKEFITRCRRLLAHLAVRLLHPMCSPL